VFQLSILHVVFQLSILHVDVMQLISANMIFFFFFLLLQSDQVHRPNPSVSFFLKDRATSGCGNALYDHSLK
jgi:hypothetical protein